MFQITRKPRFWSMVIALIFLGAILPTKAAAATGPENADITAGDRLAHNLCINCDVVDTRSPVLRTDRVPSFPWIANQEGETATSITVWLNVSHERMPNYTLTDDQIREVSAYIMSLRKR